MHESSDEHMLERILKDNDELAKHNRLHLGELGSFAINFMSAPGAGKTTLLSHTIRALKKLDHSLCVIEGDMVGDLDANRLRSEDVPVAQVSTGRSCHLDAQMIARLLHDGLIAKSDFLFIENVGNLVCPAEFPLGEHKRVVLLSVTEGDDKPLKYPVIFHTCDAVVFSKCDLLPYVQFDLPRATACVKNINSQIPCFALSVVNGQGMDEWLGWLAEGLRRHKSNRQSACQAL